MRTQKILITLGIILVFAVSSSVWAETQNFKGTIKLGYRVLDTDGSMNRYKQDYNLNQGGYLPEFTLHYTPTPCGNTTSTSSSGHAASPPTSTATTTRSAEATSMTITASISTASRTAAR
jgi:hypothetical protein